LKGFAVISTQRLVFALVVGFVIAGKSIRQKDNKIELPLFQIRRLLRRRTVVVEVVRKPSEGCSVERRGTGGKSSTVE
jgi:hypothetical protein